VGIVFPGDVVPLSGVVAQEAVEAHGVFFVAHVLGSNQVTLTVSRKNFCVFIKQSTGSG
jgi:hypothetical protein